MNKQSEHQGMLLEAYLVIEQTVDMAATVAKLRDLLQIQHFVYHSSRLGTRPSADPYIQLTYPNSWIRRYLEKGYVDVDPVVREGFQRLIPFDWSEIQITTAEEIAFIHDALAHEVGPNGFSIPVQSKQGHRGLVSISSSSSREAWTVFLESNRDVLIEIANRLHQRVVREVFGQSHLHLTTRELECLRWVASGKSTNDIAAILNISPHTARDYLKSSRHKLDCVTSAQAINKAVKLGLLTI
jgi:LuxR family transcriptional regulator, quorum-sensing system regulator CinR